MTARRFFLDHWIVLAFLFLFLSACAPAPPPPTPTATLVPPPTKTPFPIPDLDPVLTGRGVIPSCVTSWEFSEIPHPDFSDMPPPADFTSLRFTQGAAFAGRVSIFIYSGFEELDAAWPIILDTVMTPKEISGLGDLAVINFSDIVFIRCSALVHIKLVGTQPDELQIYAATLDARLQPHVCP